VLGWREPLGLAVMVYIHRVLVQRLLAPPLCAARLARQGQQWGSSEEEGSWTAKTAAAAGGYEARWIQV